MKATTYTVNEAGMREIAEFLGENHKHAVHSGEGANYWTDSMLRAWAADAEFQAGEGNPAMIEVRGMHSVSGTPVTFTVSDAGLDAQEVEIEE